MTIMHAVALIGVVFVVASYVIAFALCQSAARADRMHDEMVRRMRCGERVDDPELWR